MQFLAIVGLIWMGYSIGWGNLLWIIAFMFIAVIACVFLGSKNSASGTIQVSSRRRPQLRTIIEDTTPLSHHISERAIEGIRSSTRIHISSGLMIKSEPLDKILAGPKTWEMRATRIRKRETIALVRIGSKKIYGIADIVGCKGPLSSAEVAVGYRYHCIESSRFNEPPYSKYKFAWVLSNVHRLRYPVPYSHKKGQQNFVTIDNETASAIQAAL